MKNYLVSVCDHLHFVQYLKRLYYSIGDGCSGNNKKDHAAGKTPRCPWSFLFFFQTPSKSTFLCRIWSKMCPLKRTKKIMIFVFIDLSVFCYILLFFLDLVKNMSSNRENMPGGLSSVFLLLDPSVYC